jgi:hypothetical protein
VFAKPWLSRPTCPCQRRHRLDQPDRLLLGSGFIRRLFVTFALPYSSGLFRLPTSSPRSPYSGADRLHFQRQGSIPLDRSLSCCPLHGMPFGYVVMRIGVDLIAPEAAPKTVHPSVRGVLYRSYHCDAFVDSACPAPGLPQTLKPVTSSCAADGSLPFYLYSSFAVSFLSSHAYNKLYSHHVFTLQSVWHFCYLVIGFFSDSPSTICISYFNRVSLTSHAYGLLYQHGQ